MRRQNLISGLIILILLQFNFSSSAQEFIDKSYQPKRINKCIELLEQGQPIYYGDTYGVYEKGKEMAQTWADYIYFNMEHNPVDFSLLREFMKGLVKGGSWMIQQALAQGVHGVHLCRARDPKAIKLFVAAARYPIQQIGKDVLEEGVRGWGSHKFAAWVWGIDEKEYIKKADAWPLNPEGEIMLGVKIEDKTALENAEQSLAVPGICFAEHGPRDMGLSYGYLDGRADPPVPPEVAAAGDRVLAACKKNGVFFLDNVLPDNVISQVKKGVMIGAGRRQDSAEIGRKYMKRGMPW